MLSYGLKNLVPHRLNRNEAMTEFEYFYQQKSYHTIHLGHNEQEDLKSKIRKICENYIQIRIPYKVPTCNLVKNMGNMGNMGIFLSRIWEVYGIFQQKYGRNMGKIKVHHTKANIEDKFESKFLHLNITIF